MKIKTKRTLLTNLKMMLSTEYCKLIPLYEKGIIAKPEFEMSEADVAILGIGFIGIFGFSAIIIGLLL